MKRWYVVQVYTGYEDRVKADLEKRIQEQKAEELFGKILVPKGEMISAFSEQGAEKEKIFPGYLLVNMEMVGEAHRIVATVPRFTRFLGGESPMALTDREVERIFSQIEGGLSVAIDSTQYVMGSEVHITAGPFSGFAGVVERVDDEHERVTVMVSIFGRMTPVELGFDQVKVG
jgi:transcriptional antiterminator NusG